MAQRFGHVFGQSRKVFTETDRNTVKNQITGRLNSRPDGVLWNSRRATQAMPDRDGAIAQLGERFNGIEEVVGSIPSGSTKNPIKSIG